MPWFFRRGDKTKSKEPNTLTDETKKSRCYSCDAYPEGLTIEFDKNCPKGYLALEKKGDCAGYGPRKKSEETK